MGLVLELEQPAFLASVDVDIDEDAAGIVLLALLHVVQQALLPQVPGADGRQFHQAERLVFPAQFPADVMELAQDRFDLFLDERIIHLDGGQFRREGRMAAMVAPVGVEDPEFRLGRIALFAGEIPDDFPEVVRVHGQSPLLAEGSQVRFLHGRETFQHLDRLDVGLLAETELGQVFLTGLDGIDEIMADRGQILFGQVVIKNKQARRTDLHVCIGVHQMDAVDGRGGALVELARDVLDGKVFPAFEGTGIGNGVRHGFAENRIAAFFQQFLGESGQVIDIEEAEFAQGESEVLVEFLAEALGLDAEGRTFFDEDSLVGHCIIQGIGCS